MQCSVFSPAIQPCTTPSIPQCEGARLALFRKVSRNQPARASPQPATLVQDSPSTAVMSRMLTYAYSLARHRVPG